MKGNRDEPLFMVFTGQIAGHMDTKSPDYVHYISLLGSFTFLKDMLERIALNNRVKKLQKNKTIFLIVGINSAHHEK